MGFGFADEAKAASSIPSVWGQPGFSKAFQGRGDVKHPLYIQTLSLGL
jgi:hypothetical protein